MHDIFYITKHPIIDNELQTLKDKFPFVKIVKDIYEAQKKCLTSYFWVVWDDIDVLQNFDFTFDVSKVLQNTVIAFLNGNSYDGIFLIPKDLALNSREVDYRFFVNRHETGIVASTPKPYNKFLINTYEDYLEALAQSKTDMFWMVTYETDVGDDFLKSFYIPYHNSYAKSQNHVFFNKQIDEENALNVFLMTKKNVVTKKEIELRHLYEYEVNDVLVSKSLKYDIFDVDTYEDYLYAYENSKTEMFWATSKNISTGDFKFDLYFSYSNLYDRHENHVFVHRVNGKDTYDGLFLFSKRKKITKGEIESRTLQTRKEWPIVASGPVRYETFVIDSYDEYLYALENSKTEMFWATSSKIKTLDTFNFDLYFPHYNEYDRKINHVFVHEVQGKNTYNGVFLLNKHVPVSKREIEHRHIVHRKEWQDVASTFVPYEIFEIDTYDDYLHAYDTAKTEMFWCIPSYVIVDKDFKFDLYFLHDMFYERSTNHVFLNGEYYDGLMLCSKQSKISKKEFDYKFIANKKEVNVLASQPKPYDIVFISYQEPTADQNYELLKERFPNAKRIHGVKGIHQAHIEAAKVCNTKMFWIVDGDAIIVDSFNFDYQVPAWEHDTVHVWRSKNPINDLVYGYGGVKLFPREMTINMDLSKPDMTTSISSKFKTVNVISNITSFNTDPFNTWKSAFRECCKLSSKIIDRQKNDETEKRLKIWTTVGKDRKYGNYAIMGAKAGSLYGVTNKNSLEDLKKINDYDWLMEKFNASNT